MEIIDGIVPNFSTVYHTREVTNIDVNISYVFNNSWCGMSKNEYIFNAVIGSGVSVFDQSTSWNVLFKRIVPKSDLMHVLHYKIT